MTGPMTSNGREWKTESFKRAMFFLHHKVLKSIMLRRTKKERASEIALPPKTVLIRWDILDTVEEDHYNGFYFDTVDKIQRYILQRDILDFDRVFSLLTHLRQAVDHPYICMYSGINALVDNNSSTRDCGICHDLPDNPVVTSCTHVHPATTLEGFKSSSILNRIQPDQFRTSTKIEALREEIRFMIEGEGSAKGIVFSQFIAFLDLIKYTLDMSGVKSVQLVGGMSLAARDAAVKKFNEDPEYRILLLNFKSGGVAVNLTMASHVFLMEPWWNSTVEDQAQDRIHRIGQHKPIRVIRFLIKNTIEERIFNLQQKKKSLFKGIIGDTQGFPELTRKDVFYLLS